MSSNDLEERWLQAGAPVAEDYVDPELLSLRSRPSVLQLALLLVIMGFGAYIGWSLRLDALYYFADESPVAIGQVENLSLQLESDPDFLDRLGSNVLVTLEGIPSRRSETDDKQFAQLVGAPIFVEQQHADADVNPLLRDVRPRYSPHDERHTRFYVEGPGRLLSFEDLGSRYDGLRRFYTEGYGMWFCDQPMTHDLQQFQRLRREALAASLRQELGREPTGEELDAAVARDFSCQHGYLFQLGRIPADYIWHVVFVALIALVELLCAVFVVRWLVRWRRSMAG